METTHQPFYSDFRTASESENASPIPPEALVRPDPYALMQRSNGIASKGLESSALKAVNIYIRQHPFLRLSLGTFTTSQRRSFERNVYDYSRALNLSTRHAKLEVKKARGICGDLAEDGNQSALDGEIDDSDKIRDQLLGKDDFLNGVTMATEKVLGTSSMDDLLKDRKQAIDKTNVSNGSTASTSMVPGISKRKHIESELLHKSGKKRKQTMSANEVPIGERAHRKSHSVSQSILQNDSNIQPVQLEIPPLNEHSGKTGKKKVQHDKRMKKRAENSKARRANVLEIVATEDSSNKHDIMGTRTSNTRTNSKDETHTDQSKDRIGILSTGEDDGRLTWLTTNPQIYPEGFEDNEATKNAQLPDHNRKSRKSSKGSIRTLEEQNKGPTNEVCQPQSLLQIHNSSLPNRAEDVVGDKKGVEVTVDEARDLTPNLTAPDLTALVSDTQERPRKRKKSKKKGEAITADTALIIVDPVVSLQDAMAPLRKVKKSKKLKEAQDGDESSKKISHDQQTKSFENLSVQPSGSPKDDNEKKSDKPKKGRKRKALAEDSEGSVIGEIALEEHSLARENKDEHVMGLQSTLESKKNINYDSTSEQVNQDRQTTEHVDFSSPMI